MIGFKSRQFSTTFLLILVYVIVAAASFHGYFSKWGFMDSYASASLARILDGTAERPYVYRQLIPQMANAIDKVTPNSIKESSTAIFKYLIGHTYAALKLENLNTEYIFRYSIIYFTTFASLLISLFLLREICIKTSKSKISGTIAPIAFSLLLPSILTGGGYFYDFFELMFFTAAVLCTLRKRIIWILPIAILATLNKESFLLFIFTLIPLIRPFTSRNKLLVFICSAVLISGIVNLVVKSIYAANPGGVVVYQFVGNLKFYSNPLNYLFAFERVYGLILPKGSSIFGLLALFLVISKSWISLERPMKQHTLFALAINIPLFILFCFRDELRNLSMLFISFSTMIAIYLKDILDENIEMHDSKGNCQD